MRYAEASLFILIALIFGSCVVSECSSDGDRARCNAACAPYIFKYTVEGGKCLCDTTKMLR